MAILENLWLAVKDSALLFLAGWLGWRLLARFKIPVASLLAGIVAAGIARVLGIRFTYLPSFLPLTLKLILGTLIGLRFKKETLLNLKQLALPAFLVSFWMLASCFIAGHFFQRLTQVTPVTAILGSAPGGVAEITLLAFDFNADPAVVATLQLTRLLTIMLIIPILAIRRSQAFPNNGKLEPVESTTCWQWTMLITLAVGAAGGAIGHVLNFPTPGLLGALVMVGLVSSLYRELPPLPESLRICTQIGIGGMVGLNFGKDALAKLWLMGGPVIITTAVVIGSGLVLSAILKKITNWDDLTCLLAAAPGGVSQFFILACELGADPVIVSLLQLSRFLTVIALLPILLRLRL